METRHIRLDYGEALNAKKQLLSSEINLIYITKKIKRYKILRKKEVAQKNKLRTSMISLKAKVATLISTFPNSKTAPEKVPLRNRKHEKEEASISQELEDIKSKLSKLQ